MKRIYRRFLIICILLIIGLGCFSIKIYSQPDEFKSKANTGLLEQEYYFAFTEATRLYLFGNYVQAVNLYRECLKIKPKSAAVHYQLAKIYLNTGNSSLAKVHAINACEYDVNNKWYLQQLADIYQLDQKFDSAAIILKQLLQLDQDNISVIYSIASLTEKEARYEEALFYLSIIDNKIGASKEVYVSRYRILYAMGKKDGALRELKLAYDLSPEDYGIIGMIAEYYRDVQIPDSAHKYYNLIFPKYDADPVVVFSYTDFLLEMGLIDSAAGILVDAMQSELIDDRSKTGYFYKLLQSDTSLERTRPLLDTVVSVYYNEYFGDLRAISVFSDIEFRLGNYRKASAALKRILNIDETNYPALEQLLFCENIIGNLDSVLFYSNLAINQFRDKPVPYLFNGSAFFQKSDYSDAAKVLEKGLSLAENSALKLEFYSLLAESYENLKMYEKSVAAFEAALAVDADNIGIRNNYAYYLSLRNTDLKRALEMSGFTIEKEPENATYLDTYAWILFRMKKFRKAKKFIIRAISSGGESNSEILLHYGEILVSLKEYDIALINFNKALSDVTSTKQEEILMRIKEVKNEMNK